jgi:hypothetical protein
MRAAKISAADGAEEKLSVVAGAVTRGTVRLTAMRGLTGLRVGALRVQGHMQETLRCRERRPRDRSAGERRRAARAAGSRVAGDSA